MDIKYLEEKDVESVFMTNTRLQSTVSGYGSKIPTRYLVQLKDSRRKYRLYCMIYSNSGSCYIVRKGEKILTSRVEYSPAFQNPISI